MNHRCHCGYLSWENTKELVWMLSRLVMGEQRKWFLASSPSRDTLITCRETKGMGNCVVLVLQLHFSGMALKNAARHKKSTLNSTCCQHPPAQAHKSRLRNSSHCHTGWNTACAWGGAQLRLNQLTWRLSGPHNNPSGALGQWVPWLCLCVPTAVLPHRPWERRTLSGVGAVVHPCGGWGLLCCSGCAKTEVAGRVWGLKHHTWHSRGAFREGARLRQRPAQKPAINVL